MSFTTSSLPNAPVGVIAFDGTYEDIYSKEDWAQDVVAYNSYYNNTISYKKGTPIESHTSGWILLILLFGFSSLAYVRTMHRKRFTMLMQTFINWKVAKQIIRYEKVYAHPVNLLMNLNFILCFPLFFSLWANELGEVNMPLLSLYFSILAPFLIYQLCKLAIYKSSGWLFNEQETIEEYIFQTNLFNKYLGVVYLVLLCFLIYSPISSTFLAQLGVVILLSFLLFQLIRGLLIGREHGNQLYLIILYLCTLEILPWLIIGKWVKNLL